MLYTTQVFLRASFEVPSKSRSFSHLKKYSYDFCIFVYYGLAPVEFTFAVMSHWHFDNDIVVPARSFLAPSTRPQMLWRYILFHISRHVTGGMLVIAAFCHFPHPDKPGFIDFTNRPVSNTINGLWKKMADQGLITQVSCNVTLKSRIIPMPTLSPLVASEFIITTTI